MISKTEPYSHALPMADTEPSPEAMIRVDRYPSELVREWVGERGARRRYKVARASGFRDLEDVLGCGRWGCVYQVPGPWVVKVTADPTEAPMWARLASMRRRAPHLLEGAARTASIVKLRPELHYGPDEAYEVFAIVREEAEPFLENNEISIATAARISKNDYANINWALLGYRRAAEAFHAQTASRAQAIETMRDMTEVLELIPGADLLAITLRYLAVSAVAPQDVHLNNIGWRKHERLAGQPEAPLGLIITDPGHTPTVWQIDEEGAIQEFSVNR